MIKFSSVSLPQFLLIPHLFLSSSNAFYFFSFFFSFFDFLYPFSHSFCNLITIEFIGWYPYIDECGAICWNIISLSTLRSLKKIDTFVLCNHELTIAPSDGMGFQERFYSCLYLGSLNFVQVLCMRSKSQWVYISNWADVFRVYV